MFKVIKEKTLQKHFFSPLWAATQSFKAILNFLTWYWSSCPRALYLSPYRSGRSTPAALGVILVSHSSTHIWALLSLTQQGEDCLHGLGDEPGQSTLGIIEDG